MKHFLFCIIFCVLTVGCFSITTPEIYAQEFTPLVGIPYVDTTDSNLSLAGYVDALYKAAISIAAFLAVVKIIFAGVKYMLSDVVTSKEDAKKDIRGALIGLLIVIGAVLILNTINPQLKGLRALNGPPVDVTLETRNYISDTLSPLDAFFECNIMSNSERCTERCNRQGGYIETNGIRQNTQMLHVNESICIIPHTAQPTDIIVAEGLVIDPNIRYNTNQMSSLARNANELDILVSFNPVSRDIPTREAAVQQCENGGVNTAYVLLNSSNLSEDRLLCVSN